jgi:hypothetical protein
MLLFKARSLNWSFNPLLFLHRTMFAQKSVNQDIRLWWWAAEEDDDDAETSFNQP